MLQMKSQLRHILDDERGTALHGVLEFIIMLAIAVVLVFGIQYFLLQPYKIPTGSMTPTIEIGDYVLSEKVTYHSRGPQAGEVVTFADPTNANQILIKRCIATAGQTVDLRDGAVYVNGVMQTESYTHGKPSYPLSPTYANKTITYPYTVPSGEIWVMGDNRTNSADSRYFGSVPVSSVTGHAFYIYWPFSQAGSL